MIAIQQKKLKIHIFFLLQKQIKLICFNLSFIVNKNYSFLFFFHLFIFIIKHLFLDYILINLKCIIKNTDLDLFKRELICLILIWIKLMVFVQKSFFFFKNYKLNILRSPFVNNNTGEHLEIKYYNSLLNLKKIFNILIYKYFITLRIYVYEHSTLKLIKLLI